MPPNSPTRSRTPQQPDRPPAPLSRGAAFPIAQSSPRGPSGPRGEHGFTLIEALIAFAIASAALGVLFQGMATALSSSARAARIEGAVLRCQSHLASGLATLGGDGETVEQGRDGPTYRWRLETTPAGTASLRRGPDAATELRLYRIVATEFWTEGRTDRSLRLATERVLALPAR